MIAQILLALIPAIPMLIVFKSARDFLFGKVHDGVRVSPTPIARASLSALGGIFGASVILLIVFLFHTHIVYTTNGRVVASYDRGDGWYSAESSCEEGVIVGVACFGEGAATLTNAGVYNNDKTKQENEQNFIGHCTWHNKN